MTLSSEHPAGSDSTPPVWWGDSAAGGPGPAGVPTRRATRPEHAPGGGAPRGGAPGATGRPEGATARGFTSAPEETTGGAPGGVTDGARGRTAMSTATDQSAAPGRRFVPDQHPAPDRPGEGGAQPPQGGDRGRERDGRPHSGQTYPVRTEEDLLVVRHAVRSATVEAGFGLVDQTRVVTAASELARNAYIHGGGGVVVIERLRRHGRQGLRLTVRDEGPGIADLDEAMCDGYTTGAGLGHGLGGARRLMDEFHLDSGAQGTTVSVTRWTTP